MKYLVLCILLILGAEVTAQETGQVNFYSSALQQGEMMKFGDRSIRFKNVISDSRCPEDVTCIWAGEAIVSVEIYENGRCVEEKLIVVASTNIPLKYNTDNTSYSIEQLSLSPVPSVTNRDISKEYKLQIKLREVEEI